MIETTPTAEMDEQALLADGKAAAAAEERGAYAAVAALEREEAKYRPRELTPEEIQASKARQDRAWLIWSSPKRLARDRARAAKRRVLEAHLMCLRYERDRAAKAEAEAAAEQVRAEWNARLLRMEAAFEAGRDDWREVA